MRTACVISIGTELTLGQSLDTNSQFVSQRLAALGIRTTHHLTIGDGLADIEAALKQTAGAADILIVTGGLGPTDDDLTRRALANVAGVELERDAVCVRELEGFFAARRRVMPEANLVQALIPAGGRAIPNPSGTAPGIEITIGTARVFALPGVPSEMRAMFEATVAPAIRATAGAGVILSRKLNTIGLPESELGARISDLMARGRNPDVGTTAANAIIGVRINAAAATAEAAMQLLDRDEEELRKRLGEAVFGVDDDSLAGSVGTLLRQRGATLATAESCTGGMIGAALTDVAGSSEYFLGGVVSYSNALKVDLLGVSPATLDRVGAVSSEVAEEMVTGARDRLRATFALSTTGIAGPGGGSDAKPVGLVYIGVATPERVWSRELRLGADSSREAIRIRSTHSALDAPRRELLRTSGV